MPDVKHMRDEVASLRNLASADRYASKLTPEQRFGALALILLGVPHAVIRRFYPITSAAMSQLGNLEDMKHYGPVKRELNKIGRDEFILKYVDGNVYSQVVDIMRKPTTVADQQATFRSPTKVASGRAGLHDFYVDDGSGGKVRIDIEIMFVVNHPKQGPHDAATQSELLDLGLDLATVFPINFEDGWYFRSTYGMGGDIEDAEWEGDEVTWKAAHVEGYEVDVGEHTRRFRRTIPFNTSNDAFRAAKEKAGVK